MGIFVILKIATTHNYMLRRYFSKQRVCETQNVNLLVPNTVYFISTE